MIGLVLGGGGARGAYEVGVIKALNELGVKCEVVTGVSVGTLNAVLYAQQEQDYENIWRTIEYEKVVEHKFKWKNKAIEILVKAPFFGGFATTPLRKLLYHYLNEDKLKNSTIKMGLVYTSPLKKYNQVKIQDVDNELIIDYIITSCSAIPFLKRTKLNGRWCYDGYYSDNVPINLALEMGANKIIAVDIMKGFKKKIKDKTIPILMIKPKKKMKFFLNFNHDVIEEYISRGFEETMQRREEILAFLNA